MYCTKCGQEISEFDVYCPHCRGKIKQEPSDGDFLNFNEFKEDQNFDDLLNVDVKAENPVKDNEIDKEYEQYKENIFNKNRKTNPSYDYDNVEEFDFEDEEEKGLLGNKILIILIVIAFVTATGLGVKFLLFKDQPTPAPGGDTPNQVEEGGQGEGETNEPDTQEPSEVSSREEIFNNLSSVNSNILEVKDNPSLKYDSNADYKIADIKNSVPLDEKLYKEIGSQKIYYDAAIIKALAQFNSKWIDYVNHNDQAVISLVQKDSKAYKNVVNFSKKNKLQEFLLFEIGEIRKGEDGYYVWTHEKIKEVQNGESKIKEYNWIYHLVEGEYDFFIANYYR